MAEEEERGEGSEGTGLTVSFNPFLFTIEENSEMLRKGYEVMPIAVPDVTRVRRRDR